MQQQQAAAVELPWYQRLRWRQTSRAEAEAAERSLLALSPATLTAADIPVGPSKDHYLHTLNGGADNADSPPLVYIPGYGAGVGFMFRGLEGLAAGWRLHAVDPLGTGLSGRPPFRARSTREAEDFFVDSLAAWREAQGIDKFVLVGHSMGGYLSAVYALRHPEHVKHLVLVCPAGIGRRPDDWQPPEALRSAWTLRGQLFRLATSMWDWGATPGKFIRGAGPWGPKFVEGYTRRRFKQGHHLSEPEVVAFQNYMYAVLAARGSGEFALRHILEPFAFPREALEDRLPELRVPLTFIYGEHDWMDPKAAARTNDKLGAARTARGDADRLAAGDLRVLTTPNAGHYPFIDQPGAFLENLLEAVGEYLPAAAVARVRAAAAKMPLTTAPSTDTKAELEAEMKSNPAAAEAHVAADM